MKIAFSHPNKKNHKTEHSIILSYFNSSPSEISTIDEEISKENSFEKAEEWNFCNQIKLSKKQAETENSKIPYRIDFNKYKTEICKSWQEKGFCTYGKLCLFAHGRNELMQKDCYGAYKSKLCKSFHQKFYCPYGSRCLFIHEDRRLCQINAKHYYMKKINSINRYKCEENRLAIFYELQEIKA